MIDAIGWLGTILVLLAYWRGGKTFDWANVALFPLVALPAVFHHAYSNVAICIVFGLIGAKKLWR